MNAACQDLGQILDITNYQQEYSYAKNPKFLYLDDI
jgi:hypothetical protein